MKLINLLMDLFFVLVDAIKALFNILIGTLSTFLLNSKKKDNEFKRLLGTENYFVDTIILLGLFFGIGYFSIFIAALFLLPSIFIVYEYKKKWHNNQNRSIPDDSFVFSGVTAVILSLLIITLVNT